MQLERKSLHQACPVLKKSSGACPSGSTEREEAIEQKPQEVPKVKSADGCDDSDDLCEMWVAAGECTRNAGYMVRGNNAALSRTRAGPM